MSSRAVVRSLVPWSIAVALMVWQASRPGPQHAGRTPLPSFSTSAGVPAPAPGALTTIEANVGQFKAPVRFVARTAAYTAALDPQGVTVELPTEAGTLDVLRWSFADGRDDGFEPHGEARLPGVSHYYFGRDAASWHLNVPHFSRVRYADVGPGIDLLYYGNTEGQLEFDVEVDAGADVSALSFALAGARRLAIDEAGRLVIDTGRVQLAQSRPVAFHVDDRGQREAVEASYRLDAFGRVGFDVPDHDPARRLVIDPSLVYSTYFGGALDEFPDDRAASVAVDSARNLYLAGHTNSTTLYTATTTGAQTGSNLFVSKLNAAGSALLFTTFIGGNGSDLHAGLAVDASGTPYISGRTSSTNLPVTAGALQPTHGGGATDGFVAGLTPAGTLAFLTYLGGSADDGAEDIKVNAAGNMFVVGWTSSLDFPVVQAYQPAKGAGPTQDAFVTKLTASGSAAVFSTYLGGAALDLAFSLAVDNLDQVYVGGRTLSTNFPVTPGAFQTVRRGNEDIFVAKFAAAGSSVLFSTYLGGTDQVTVPPESSYESGRIAIDLTGNVYVAGFTNATDFPAGVASPVPQASFGGGKFDAVVAKLNTSGTSLLYRTYLGGSSDDLATWVSLDQYGNAYVTGSTASTDFPVAGTAWDTTYGGNPPAQDAFVAKIGASGQSLAYSSYLGGSGSDIGLSLALDGQGAAYVGGLVTSLAFPTVNAFDSTLGGTIDAFLTKVGFQDDNTNGIPDDQEPPGGGGSGDSDGDGLPDDWENSHGLDPNDPTGDNGANGDPDNDGSTNIKEFQDGTNPTLAEIRYFAEGATSSFFDDDIALANPSATITATVVLRFRDALGVVRQSSLSIAPRRRATVDPKTLTDVTTGANLGLAVAEFSTEVRSNITVVSDRTMSWDANGYGAHAETSVAAPSATWYLAEGATIGGFNLFYLIQNVNATDVNVTVRYLLPDGTNVLKVYVVTANSRRTIWVNTITELQNKEISAVLTSPPATPIIVERAMYLDSQGRTFGAGHNSAGITAPALNWFLAEGATGPQFDMFVLAANPNAIDAAVRADYLLATGQVVTRFYNVRANSRFNIWVDADPALANAEVSTRISSTNGVPIIVERAMWWPGSSSQWYEAHNSPGTTQTGTRWGLAEGEVGGTGDKDTFILIANTSNFAGTARVTLLFEDGTAPSVRDYGLLANSRRNVWVRADFPAAAGKRFGAIVESLGATPAQVVIERAIYSTALDATPGEVWSAGSNALGLRLQ